jgi:hypothetical protein
MRERAPDLDVKAAPLMGFRADPATRASIVRWAENQADMPSLSEAIRRLVELGLTAGAKKRSKQLRAAALIAPKNQPRKHSRGSSTPALRQRNVPNARGVSPKDRRSFGTLASISQRQKVNKIRVPLPHA